MLASGANAQPFASRDVSSMVDVIAPSDWLATEVAEMTHEMNLMAYPGSPGDDNPNLARLRVVASLVYNDQAQPIGAR
jgi:hypothetical protein